MDGMSTQQTADSRQRNSGMPAHCSQPAVSLSNPLTAHSTKGFTLMELLVVVGIFVVVTSVVLTSNTRFGGVFQLQNLAYDVALTIRQAQVYGISVRQTEAGEFSSAYGVYFNQNDPVHYELFEDGNGSNFFDTGENVPPSPYVIGRNFSIAKLCAPAGDSADTCSAATRLDITFKRPEPDAFIRANDLAALHKNARIVFRSPRGDELSVIVEITGGISVQSDNN